MVTTSHIVQSNFSWSEFSVLQESLQKVFVLNCASRSLMNLIKNTSHI